MRASKTNVKMEDVINNPRYRGKHLILAAGNLYTSKTGEGALEIIEKIREKHPDVTPETAYLPKSRTIII
jgi:hypothetical protein